MKGCSRLSFISKLTGMEFTYEFPSLFNFKFLQIEYYSFYLFSIIESNQIFQIIVRLFAEQSFLIISDSQENLTSICLGLSSILLPFKWPFINISYLPQSMYNYIDSPVPYIIGIKDDDTFKNKLLKDTTFINNIIIISKGKATLVYHQTLDFSYPYIKNMQEKMEALLRKIKCKVNKLSISFAISRA